MDTKMDMKKIGTFLKLLRKERGLTQEQLAEKFFVSAKTVSRWETGTNLPDLSILIEMAEFYDVDVKELLDGERKSEIMDQKTKETLSKVADYSKLEKEKAVKAGSTAFGLTFVLCAAVIVIQLATTGKLAIVAGETVVLLAGGAVYIGVMVYHGIWEIWPRFKNTLLADVLIGTGCAAVFSVAFGICCARWGLTVSQAVHSTVVFFIGIAAACFAVLRILAYCSRKRKAGSN